MKSFGLRSFLSVGILALSATSGGVASAENRGFPCGPDGPGAPLAEYYFMGPTPSGALLPLSSSVSGWIEIRYEKGHLRLAHRFPGIGLPFELHHVRATWIDRDGRERPDRSAAWPARGACGRRAVFPGDRFNLLRIEPSSVEPGFSRLRVEIWGDG